MWLELMPSASYGIIIHMKVILCHQHYWLWFRKLQPLVTTTENEITSSKETQHLWVINVMLFFILYFPYFSEIFSYLFQVFAEKNPADYIHTQAKWVFQAPLPWLWRELQGERKQNKVGSLGSVCNLQNGPAGVAQEGTFSTSGSRLVGLSLHSHLRALVMWMTQCAGASRGFSFFIYLRCCG